MGAIYKPDKRLALCAYFVRKGMAVADIGTDHAYLPIWLVETAGIPRAVAADINEGPLMRARENIKKCGLEEKIGTRLSNGLERIEPDEADDIIIAGMGAELICKIISACGWIRDSKKHLILQPMSKYEVLLRFLYENGFSVAEQKCTQSGGKYYTVILCSYSGKTEEFSETDCFLGKLDLNDGDSRAFLNKKLCSLKKRAIGEPQLENVISEIEARLSAEEII